jgi:hypothetical protein
MTLNSDEGSVTADVAAHQRLSRTGVPTAAPLLYPFYPQIAQHLLFFGSFRSLIHL